MSLVFGTTAEDKLVCVFETHLCNTFFEMLRCKQQNKVKTLNMCKKHPVGIGRRLVVCV